MKIRIRRASKGVALRVDAANVTAATESPPLSDPVNVPGKFCGQGGGAQCLYADICRSDKCAMLYA